MNIKTHFSVHHKLKILAYGKEHKNVSETCRFFDISREPYYKWKRDYEKEGRKPSLILNLALEIPRAGYQSMWKNGLFI